MASLPLFAEDIVFSPPEEARAELFAMDLGDTDVSLFLSGSWKGTLSSSGGLALTEFGWTAASTEGPLLFAQESDLTLELIIRERWFVEASFLDDYALNTYRTGYRGTEGEAIQYLGLGNIGLDFPNFPYMNLGGDAPNSFGAYGKVVLSDYSFHALIRYDTAVREERVFVGNRERTMIDLAIENRLRGRAFTLPDQNLDASPQVFIEDSAGEYRASDGRKYRRARASEYSVSALRGLVELNSSPESRIAVTYTKNGDDEAWLSSLGSYLPSAGFLGEAQDAFTAHNDKIKLSEYPQPGEGDDFYNVTDRPATLDIAGYKALVIYEKGAFSPFEWGNRYASPAASGLGASASLVHLSNGTELSEFDLAPLNKNTDAGKSIFELQNLQYGPDPRSIHTRWPLLSENPEVYLSGLKGSGADLVLRFTSYGSASSLSIGTDVVASSVEVYRDGLLDSGAQFDVQSGSILLNRPPLASELIRVSYLKRSEERRFGSIAAGLGGIYDPEGPFSSRLALGLRWNINNEAFSQALPNSENRSANPGSVGLSASVAW
ncbi:hypothetical protein MASR2M78_32630 [Treponema sp.]